MDTLDSIRQEIASVDDTILTLLGKRSTLIKKIGRIKKEQNIAVLDVKREEEIMSTLMEKAKKIDLDQNFIHDIWERIFSFARTIQK